MPQPDLPALYALRHTVFGEFPQQMTIRDAIAGLADVPEPNTPDQDALRSYDLLRKLIAGLGGSSVELASDHRRLAAVFDWAAIAAPRLLPILSGHFNLTIGALLRLGDPASSYQSGCLDELDSVRAVGVCLLTELGFGTRVGDLQTTATRHPGRRAFVLDTPAPAAIKFMPNVAADTVAKTVIVAARLIADGRDEGIWPFLLRLRSDTTVTSGVSIAALPPTASAAMDHAMIRFQGCEIPEDAWLHGGLAHLRADGSVVSDLDHRQRLAATIGQLQSGRICLAGAAVASARAALATATHYAQQRMTARDIPMADRDAVQRDLVSCAASVWAMTTLAQAVHGLFATDTDPALAGLAAMLAKPLLSNTAYSVVETCRQRCGAQGLIQANYFGDWAAIVRGVVTAEGENQALQIAAGRALYAGTVAADLIVPTLPTGLPWWHRLLAARVDALADKPTTRRARTGAETDCQAIDRATAVAERLALDALTAAAQRCPDPTAAQLLSDLAAVYALERINTHAGWFAAAGQLSPHRATDLHTQLAQHRARLVTHLPTLTRAFAIPQLPTPLHQHDYITAWLDHSPWRDNFPATDTASPPFAPVLR